MMIRSSMSKGDLVSVARQLMWTMKRRPRNGELWDLFSQLFQTGSVDGKVTDGLLDAILRKDGRNHFCFEWKAMRLLQEADSPESDTLVQAKKILEQAIEYSYDSSRLFRTIARVRSCESDLEGAVQALREAQRESRNNVQLSLELAMLYMRMGANYFSSAIASVQEIPDESEEKQVWLAYLFAFLGEMEKADRAFKAFSELKQRGEWMHLWRSHLLLIQGEREKAIRIAESQTRQAANPSEINNWAELIICTESFDRAIEMLLTSAKTGNRTDESRTALIALARYLAGAGDVSQNNVIESWREMITWGFKELILFRERVRRGENTELADRLTIVERLIQQQELSRFRLRQGTWIYGPGGVGQVRILPRKLGKNIGAQVVTLSE